MMTYKQCGIVALVATAACALALSARAQGTNILVNDTWRAGNRLTPGTYPQGPLTYAENNGVTATPINNDGDLSSAWFKAGSGNLAIVTNNPPITGPNILEASTSSGGGSAHWYTYFTQPGTAVTLSYPSLVSQEMRLTWDFTPYGDVAQNSNLGLTLALGLTPNGTRSTNDMTLAKANYTNAFAAYINMGTTLGTTPALSIRKWTLAGSGSLAGTAANYGGSLAGAGAVFNQGYVDGTPYSFVMDLDMTAAGLQVTETMSGGNLNGSGTLTATYLDTSFAGQSVSYDTFVIRPTSQAITASTFDTSLFQVIIIPEPSTVALVVMGLGLAVGLIRRRRS